MNYETYPALDALPVVHAFTRRIPGLDVTTDRDTALARLASHHDAIRAELGLADRRFIFAEQIHGATVAVVDSTTPVPIPATDALITADPSVCLGIYVADCGPVFFADPARRVVACAHSGKKGTQLAIAAAVVERMRAEFGCDPAGITAQLGPCIRPPNYETDFAADIRAQLRAAGVQNVHDCAACTAAAPDTYYSYRRELGKTGRMLALIAVRK